MPVASVSLGRSRKSVLGNSSARKSILTSSRALQEPSGNGEPSTGSTSTKSVTLSKHDDVSIFDKEEVEDAPSPSSPAEASTDTTASTSPPRKSILGRKKSILAGGIRKSISDTSTSSRKSVSVGVSFGKQQSERTFDPSAPSKHGLVKGSEKPDSPVMILKQIIQTSPRSSDDAMDLTVEEINSMVSKIQTIEKQPKGVPMSTMREAKAAVGRTALLMIEKLELEHAEAETGHKKVEEFSQMLNICRKMGVPEKTLMHAKKTLAEIRHERALDIDNIVLCEQTGREIAGKPKAKAKAKTESKALQEQIRSRYAGAKKEYEEQQRKLAPNKAQSGPRKSLQTGRRQSVATSSQSASNTGPRQSIAGRRQSMAGRRQSVAERRKSLAALADGDPEAMELIKEKEDLQKEIERLEAKLAGKMDAREKEEQTRSNEGPNGLVSDWQEFFEYFDKDVAPVVSKVAEDETLRRWQDYPDPLRGKDSETNLWQTNARTRRVQDALEEEDKNAIGSNNGNKSVTSPKFSRSPKPFGSPNTRPQERRPFSPPNRVSRCKSNVAAGDHGNSSMPQLTPVLDATEEDNNGTENLSPAPKNIQKDIQKDTQKDVVKDENDAVENLSPAPDIVEDENDAAENLSPAPQDTDPGSAQVSSEPIAEGHSPDHSRRKSHMGKSRNQRPSITSCNPVPRLKKHVKTVAAGLALNKSSSTKSLSEGSASEDSKPDTRTSVLVEGESEVGNQILNLPQSLLSKESDEEDDDEARDDHELRSGMQDEACDDDELRSEMQQESEEDEDEEYDDQERRSEVRPPAAYEESLSVQLSSVLVSNWKFNQAPRVSWGEGTGGRRMLTLIQKLKLKEQEDAMKAKQEAAEVARVEKLQKEAEEAAARAARDAAAAEKAREEEAAAAEVARLNAEKKAAVKAAKDKLQAFVEKATEQGMSVKEIVAGLEEAKQADVPLLHIRRARRILDQQITPVIAKERLSKALAYAKDSYKDLEGSTISTALDQLTLALKWAETCAIRGEDFNTGSKLRDELMNEDMDRRQILLFLQNHGMHHKDLQDMIAQVRDRQEKKYIKGAWIDTVCKRADVILSQSRNWHFNHGVFLQGLEDGKLMMKSLSEKSKK